MELGLVSVITCFRFRFVLFRFSTRFPVLRLGVVFMLCRVGNAGVMLKLGPSMFGRLAWLSSLACVRSQRRPRLRV
jgi:hypothetical protein